MLPSNDKLDNAVTGQQSDYIRVPRNPTKEMLEAAWADSLGEDAGGVWKAMIERWESSLKGVEIQSTEVSDSPFS